MKYYLLHELDPDGLTNIVTDTPIAIIAGETQDAIAKIALRVIITLLAAGNNTRIAEIESEVVKEFDAINEAFSTDNGYLNMDSGNYFLFLKPIKVDFPHLSSLHSGARKTAFIHFDEATGVYEEVSGLEVDLLPYPTYEVDIIDVESYDFPLLKPSCYPQ